MSPNSRRPNVIPRGGDKNLVPNRSAPFFHVQTPTSPPYAQQQQSFEYGSGWAESYSAHQQPFYAPSGYEQHQVATGSSSGQVASASSSLLWLDWSYCPSLWNDASALFPWLQLHGTIAWANFQPGQPNGYVQFMTPEEAGSALYALNGFNVFGGPLQVVAVIPQYGPSPEAWGYEENKKAPRHHQQQGLQVPNTPTVPLSNGRQRQRGLSKTPTNCLYIAYGQGHRQGQKQQSQPQAQNGGGNSEAEGGGPGSAGNLSGTEVPHNALEVLWQETAKCGRVVHWQPLADRTCLFVHFSSVQDASQALEKLNGKIMFGSRLNVNYAQSFIAEEVVPRPQLPLPYAPSHTNSSNNSISSSINNSNYNYNNSNNNNNYNNNYSNNYNNTSNNNNNNSIINNNTNNNNSSSSNINNSNNNSSSGANNTATSNLYHNQQSQHHQQVNTNTFQRPRTRNHAEPTNCIYVAYGNEDYNAVIEELQRHGEITSVKALENRTCAFVHFSTVQQASDALASLIKKEWVVRAHFAPSRVAVLPSSSVAQEGEKAPPSQVGQEAKELAVKIEDNLVQSIETSLHISDPGK